MLELVVILLLLLPAVNAKAHDYWFTLDGNDYLLHRGHFHYSQHEGADEVPFDSSIITATRCLRPEQSAPGKVDVSTQYPLRIEGPCLAVFAAVNSGNWSQTLMGTKNQGKDELFGVLRSWQALETIKRVEAWDPRLTKPLSNELELVFTKDPFSLSTGDKLRLAAMLDGKPIQGVTVAYDGDPRGVSAKDGRINLKIRRKGLQSITASLEEPLVSDKADKRIRSTTLMFVIE